MLMPLQAMTAMTKPSNQAAWMKKRVVRRAATKRIANDHQKGGASRPFFLFQETPGAGPWQDLTRCLE